MDELIENKNEYKGWKVKDFDLVESEDSQIRDKYDTGKYFIITFEKNGVTKRLAFGGSELDLDPMFAVYEEDAINEYIFPDNDQLERNAEESEDHYKRERAREEMREEFKLKAMDFYNDYLSSLRIPGNDIYGKWIDIEEIPNTKSVINDFNNYINGNEYVSNKNEVVDYIIEIAENEFYENNDVEINREIKNTFTPEKIALAEMLKTNRHNLFEGKLEDYLYRF